MKKLFCSLFPGLCLVAGGAMLAQGDSMPLSVEDHGEPLATAASKTATVRTVK